MGRRKKRFVKEKQLIEPINNKFLWVKFNEVRVFWPVKVLEQSESDDTVQIYVKSDDAYLEVKKRNAMSFEDNLEHFRDKGIAYLTRRKNVATLNCFKADVEWAEKQVKSDNIDEKNDEEGNPYDIDDQSDKEGNPDDLDDQSDKEGNPNDVDDQNDKEGKPDDLDDQSDKEGNPDELDDQSEKKGNPDDVDDQNDKEGKPYVLDDQSDKEGNPNDVDDQNDAEDKSDEEGNTDCTFADIDDKNDEGGSDCLFEDIDDKNDEEGHSDDMDDKSNEEWNTDCTFADIDDKNDEGGSDCLFEDIDDKNDDEGNSDDMDDKSDGVGDSDCMFDFDDSDKDKTYQPSSDREMSDSDYENSHHMTAHHLLEGTEMGEEVEDSVSEGEQSDIYPALINKAVMLNSGKSDTDETGDELKEDEILRDNKNPGIYITRVLKSAITKYGKMKKNDRVFNSYQYCGACKVKTSNLAQHLSRHDKVDHPHTKHPDIQAIKAEKNATLKKKLLKSLRGKFNHEHNMKTIQKGKGEILLERRPVFESWNLNDYGPCPRCLFWMAKRLLKKHEKTCIHRQDDIRTSLGDLTTQSECIAQQIKPIANKKLVKEVFSKMAHDEVSKVAKNDTLIVQLGNQWMERVRGNVLKRGSYTSQIMRLVGRFFLNLKKVKSLSENTEPSLWDYLKPEHFNSIVDAAILTAAPVEDDDDDDSLGSPSNAIKLGYDIKRLINGKIGISIMNKDPQSQADAENLIKLMNIYWGTKVTKHARVILEERRYYAVKNLPLPEDIQKLGNYLRDSLLKIDLRKTDSTNFREVGRLIEAKLVTYNRRRTGEVQAIRLADYARRIKGQNGAHLVGDLSKFEQHLLETQEVMTVRGKTGRPVPIILPKETVNGLQYLTDPEIRKSAGVSPSNNYVFASQGDSIIWAYDALRKTAEAAMLLNPDTITSTNLRKYMATITQVLDLKENQLQWVLNHMGHTIDVHKLHYRATSDILERTQIAKILMLQDQGRVGEFTNRCLNDIEFEDIVFKTTTQPTQEVRPVPGPDTDVLSRPDMIMETLDEAENFFEEEICGAPKPRRRQQKPVIKISWTEEEELEIKRLLKGFFEHKKRPKPVDCARAIEKSRKNNGVIWKRKKDVLKKKVFRMIDSLKL